MNEDDEGKTVFQPSKRKTVQKESAHNHDAQKLDIAPKELSDETTEEKAPEQKTDEEMSADTEEVKSKKAMQFDVGDVLNNVYEIKRFIAKGGMGEVYEAVNVHNTDERVAIKVMLPEFAADERVIAMFAKEAGTLTRLHHEAIVPYRLSSRDELGRPFIVTAYVDGPSLEDQFKVFSPTEDELGRLTRRLAEGLGKAHSFGAIHRDIAPDNVLLVGGNPGLPKIIDFGIAQDARAENKGATIIGDGFAGKLNYVAPEQLGEYGRNIGPWTDLYSLALTMLAVATQKHADMGGSIASAVKKRMTVPDISAIPPRFRRAFKAALQPDPTQRPQSMAAFIDLLDKPSETEKASTFAPLGSDAPAEMTLEVVKNVKPKGIDGKGKLISAGIGAAALIGLVSIFVISRGSGETIDTGAIIDTAERPSVPDRDIRPPARETIEPVILTKAIIEQAMANVPCAWLNLESANSLESFNADRDTLKIVGGAANIPEARNAIMRSLRERLDSPINLDLSEVAKFEHNLCDFITTLEEIKSGTPLITSPDKSRVYEIEKHDAYDAAGKRGVALYQTISVDVSNIETNEFITTMSIDPRGLLMPLTKNRTEMKPLIERYEGQMRSDGFNLTFPTALESDKREGYGFVIISGGGDFPRDIFTNRGPNGEFQLSESWMRKFKALSVANRWKSDIYWYSVEDKVSN